MQAAKIGIFDSGMGGLTVFREVADLLPHEDLIYLGDTARVPYGTKSRETVTRYALQNVRFLLERSVKMIVVACNTASAFSLEELKRHLKIPILGVIDPGVKGALRHSDPRPRPRRIGVIGTEGTISSNAYPNAIKALDPEATIASVACPLFVPLVEEGRWEGEVVERVARDYLEKIQKVDTLILGCTHYPLLKEVLQKVVGEGVTLIDSAKETAREAAEMLAREGLQNRRDDGPRHEFLVTDSPERFHRIGSLFLKQSITHVQHIEI